MGAGVVLNLRGRNSRPTAYSVVYDMAPAMRAKFLRELLTQDSSP